MASAKKKAAPSFSPQQESALRAISTWVKTRNAPQIFRMFGFAGTGKTTLAKHIAEEVGGNVVFGAFTGKASLVLRSKGCKDASTIHSMIYTLDEDKGDEPQFMLNPESRVAGCDLVIIDECSMVDEQLGKDLLSFRKKVLVLGDPAQLPPVKGAGFFTNAEPDVMLTEIHRQAAESPILRLATLVREGGRLEPCVMGATRVVRRADINSQDALGADQILVGLNRSRTNYNHRMRELTGKPAGLPVAGDRLVCLRNSRDKGLFNGGIWTAQAAEQARDIILMMIAPADAGVIRRPFEVHAHRSYFDGTDKDFTFSDLRNYEAFDYGYALTVHKSQGSQWDNVLLFDESASFREDRSRWLYTGITRAAEKLTVVLS
jgi:exodeoxyribonuclease-5